MVSKEKKNKIVKELTEYFDKLFSKQVKIKPDNFKYKIIEAVVVDLTNFIIELFDEETELPDET